MLLDVNLLLALAWPNHQHHVVATRWFGARDGSPWATCALTELAFVRLSSNPAFTAEAKDPVTAVALLAAMTAHAHHHYLLELPSVTASERWSHVGSSKTTTDAYLVMVAAHHGVPLATLDGRLARNPAFAAGTLLVT